MAARFQNNGRRGRAASNGALSPSLGISRAGAGRRQREDARHGQHQAVAREQQAEAAPSSEQDRTGNPSPVVKTPRLGFARPIRLAVIGAGKVGCSLSRYLASGPAVEVVGFYSRNPLASEEAVGFAGGRIFATAADAVRAAEVILITTPDGVIADVWEQLKAEAGYGEGVRSPMDAEVLAGEVTDENMAGGTSEDAQPSTDADGLAASEPSGAKEGDVASETAAGNASASECGPEGADASAAASPSNAAGKTFSWNATPKRPSLNLAGKIFVHCSGALPSTVLEGANELGASAVAMHPLYAVSSRFACWHELEQAWFSLEGDPEGTRVLEALLRARGNQILHIGSEDKTRYHAAAVMASNLVVGLYNMAADELIRCGIPKKDAQAALAPLFMGNASHVAEGGVEASLTGPAARGDWTTLNAHLSVLDDDERRLAAYRALTDELIAIAHPSDEPGGVSTPA